MKNRSRLIHLHSIIIIIITMSRPVHLRPRSLHGIPLSNHRLPQFPLQITSQPTRGMKTNGICPLLNTIIMATNIHRLLNNSSGRPSPGNTFPKSSSKKDIMRLLRLTGSNLIKLSSRVYSHGRRPIAPLLREHSQIIIRQWLSWLK
jgi:hypothetical protein